jgi:hypothetical protein
LKCKVILEIPVRYCGHHHRNRRSEELPDDNRRAVYVAAITKNTHDIRKLKLARGRADDRENIRLAASSHALDMAIRMGRLV